MYLLWFKVCYWLSVSNNVRLNLPCVIFSFSFVRSQVDSLHRIRYWEVTLCNSLSHTYMYHDAHLFQLKTVQNPCCSRTRWVSSTFGKLSVRKAIRGNLKQTKFWPSLCHSVLHSWERGSLSPKGVALHDRERGPELNYALSLAWV